MQSAAVNTVIGIATVFLMLLFLSFVISLMVYIPKLEAALKKKKAPKAPAPESNNRHRLLQHRQKKSW